jgi:Fe-S oxidoreductase
MKQLHVRDISKPGEQLAEVAPEELIPLPYPYDKWEDKPIKPISEEQKNAYESSLDGVVALTIPRPKSKEEEEKLVEKFLSGLKKLLSKEDNWTFLQPLMHTLNYCGKCLICSDACPVYLASGKQEIYRPAFRAEIVRRIKEKYIDNKGKTSAWFKGNDVELNWNTVARLAELAYRCMLCRRCAQCCSRGIDNGLLTHELRKLFSQEMGIAPKELHERGTIQQLKVGSSTGISPQALENIISFMEEEIEEKTGRKIKVPIDKKGADILLLHNAGEYLSWPENTVAFAIILEAAGINWTLSSDLIGYDSVNYGVWYDDIQFARIALKHIQIAQKMGVKKIIVGECGHAHKALITIADRILAEDKRIPRESAMPLLEDIVCNEKIKLDPQKNNFPVTLHDPCNMVRMMGIVDPQRRILRKICPQFREMEPHGVENYCCGGGSGFAVCQSMNFPEWKATVSGRMKFKQILEAFHDVISPEIKKYVCAPCSNCKGQIRDIINYYNAWEKCRIYYGGLVELIANAMVDLREPFIEWEWH